MHQNKVGFKSHYCYNYYFNKKISHLRKQNVQDKNWVNVIKDGGCYSWIGRHQNGGQTLSLSKCKQIANLLKTNSNTIKKKVHKNRRGA